VGREITAAYPRELVVLGLLRQLHLLSDLVRRLDARAGGFPVAASYGAATIASGDGDCCNDPETDYGVRHILLVEDIVDTGRR